MTFISKGGKGSENIMFSQYMPFNISYDSMKKSTKVSSIGNKLIYNFNTVS